jgi:Holliday junction resolvase RusA-like endonuclease
MTEALFEPADGTYDPGVLAIDVTGTPTTQGSKKPFINPQTGRAQMKEQLGKALDRWRGDVMRCAHDALPEGWEPLTGPLRVTVVFRIERPRYHYRTGQSSHLLRDDAPVYADKAKDLDKLIRGVGDALTDVGVYRDDKQICDLGQSKKLYCAPGERPGALIIVRPL